MLIVAGHLTVHPCDRDRYVVDCPDRVNVFELWDSRELLAAFRGTGPDAGMRARILDAQITDYDVS